MKILQSFDKHGYSFDLYQSMVLGNNPANGMKRYKAIYVGKSDKALNDNIEVVIVSERPPVESWGEEENKIAYPSSDKWGTLGWTYCDIDQAIKKFNEIK